MLAHPTAPHGFDGSFHETHSHGLCSAELQQLPQALSEQDFFELQQLEYPLEQLLMYAPTTPEDLGLSTSAFTERHRECCFTMDTARAVVEHQYSMPHESYLVQQCNAVPFPSISRYDSVESSAPSSPGGSDRISASDISESSERSLTSKQRKTAWTNIEDQIIEEGVATFGHKWSKIAEMLPYERTDDAVRNRWQRLSRRKQRRLLVLQRQVSGGSERGEPLADLPDATNVGGCIAADLPARPVHCKPSSSKAQIQALAEEQGKHGDMWTPEEDQIIDVAVRIQGLRWRAIAAMLPGRTDSGCRNRWVRSQERQFAAAGIPVHGAAEVFAALRAAGKLPGLSSAAV